MTPPIPAPTLTSRLLNSDPAAFSKATQSAFLRSAALGQLQKDTLGTWLANDRLYIHSYIKAAGLLLAFLEYPQAIPKSGAGADAFTVRLLEWVIDALVNIRREEKFFLDAASRYGIPIDLPIGEDGRASDAAKLEGLRRFEDLFGSVSPGNGSLPWLEAAVLFYATEKAYLEAWTWAKSQLVEQDPSEDADGGALRVEFIPNWTSKEFVVFVDQLGDIIDEAVSEQVGIHGVRTMEELSDRALKVWARVLAAEEVFWPEVPGAV
ncbi:related to transcription regulator PAB1642 [Cephalotrichum gorgonifer]|uniref:Related to transcription regulator PAB1642 n=1 Tax=Cephalotrichum gorgonifer TaxID=2041049 RepID=A0AAE8SZR9_9PEZI|nr:related to transcription regulator PAB1642 [Cephalotrichum gorgonifer]